ncbi:MAG: hypothetical protein ACYS30_19690 [Planctomycetota bacterium]|jgi:hypothetical protein
MRTHHFKHIDVNKDGTCKSGGAVETKGVVRLSSRGGGCTLNKCNCSPGHWICVTLPRTNKGVVEGVTLYFDNEKQLTTFAKSVANAAQNR